MSRIIEVDHLTRVEGHGGLWVELEGDRVSEVQFRIFEGLRLVEGLLRGRQYADVSQIVSRVCAICSVAHSLTSIKATEDAFDVRPTHQTVLLRDLMFRGESIESHALHLFLLALPDYLGYPSAMHMAADHGKAVELGLRLKKLGNAIQETIGGRAVHPVNAVVGGFGKLPTIDQLLVLREGLQAGIEDCQAAIELIAALPAVKVCEADTVYAAMRSLDGYGYYLGDAIVVRSNRGDETLCFDHYRSLADESPVPYSHAKVSVHHGRPFMVGALARLMVNANHLSDHAVQAIHRLGLTLPSRDPLDNNKAQAVELVYDVERAWRAVNHLLEVGLEREPPPEVIPRSSTGTGVCEAPRGLLIHSYTYDADGILTAADIVTPTALNAASVENHIRQAVEQSGDKEISTLRKTLEMIARAYDPCISCAVH